MVSSTPMRAVATVELPARPVSLRAERLAQREQSTAPAKPAVSPAVIWGPQLVVLTILAGIAGVVVGIEWAMSGFVIIAMGIFLYGLRVHALGLLGAGLLFALEPLATDLLLSPEAGNPLGVMTLGVWRYNTIAYAFLLAGATSIRFVWRENDIHTTWLKALLLLQALQLGITSDVPNGIQQMLDYATWFGVMTVLARVVKDDKAWYWMAVVTSVAALVASFLYYSQLGRLPHTNPNNFVYTPLSALFAICLAFKAAGTSTRQVGLWLMAVTALASAFLSTSRGGLLTGIPCLLFLTWQMRHFRQRFALMIFVLLVGLGGVAAFSHFQTKSAERFELLFDSKTSIAHRTSGRSDLFVGGWEIFQHNPLGIGTGGFENAWSRLGSVDGQRQFMRSGKRFPPHSGWTRVTVENGIAGIVIFACWIFSFAIAAWRQAPNSHILGVGILATVAMCVGFISVEAHHPAIWLLSGGAAVQLQARRMDQMLAAVRPKRRTRPKPQLVYRPAK